MGSYTPNQRFYLIGGDEFVNVNQDLNYNVERADRKVRRLVEYEAIDTNTSGIPVDVERDIGYKWYKPYSNSLWVFRDGFTFQDPNQLVNTWVQDYTYSGGYTDYSTDTSVAFMVYDGWVYWRGRFKLTSGGEIPKNVATTFMTIPGSVRHPTKPHYVTTYGGQSTGTDFQQFRIYIPPQSAPSTQMQFFGYGGNSASTGERYVSLNEVFYSITE